mmetsp:Transcript_126667/g.352943  ORF Transcript_126667/g.352943 Transcript_126667/m.352943 type:complete len:351 (+) Transcript_126667:97-1149(+)
MSAGLPSHWLACLPHRQQGKENELEASMSLSSGRPAGSVVEQLHSVLLDILIFPPCICLWAGVWNCLDASEVSAMSLGSLAAVLSIALAVSEAHNRLEELTKHWQAAPLLAGILSWTSFLIFGCIVVWWAAFAAVDLILPEGNNRRALLLTLIGAGSLLAVGRFRTSGEAPQAASSADMRDFGGRFAPCCFSAASSDMSALHLFGAAVMDLVLTSQVVLVWAGLWMVADNFNVPLVPSLVNSILSIATIRLLPKWAPESAMLKAVLGALRNGLLTALVVLAWRGLWLLLNQQLLLPEQPHLAATLALLGAGTMAGLGRLRAAVVPPADFTRDRELGEAGGSQVAWCYGTV